MTLTATIPDNLLLSNHLFYVLVGEEGRYLTANPHFQNTFGVTTENNTDFSFARIVHPDDKAAFHKIISECKVHPGKPVTAVLKRPVPHTHYTHVKWEFICLQEVTGEEAVIQAIGFDISNGVKTDEPVHKNKHTIFTDNKALESLLINSIDIILLVDASSVISFCSPNITREMGYTQAEMIGKTGFDFVHPDDQPAAFEIFEKELKYPDQNNSVDVRLRKKDGTWLWVEAKGKNLLDDPLVQGVIINLNNISTRKAAEEALQQSETRYRSFFENLPYPLFLVETNSGAIANCNNSTLQKYGYSYAELMQMNFTDLFEEQPEFKDIEELCRQQVLVRHQKKSGELIIAKLEHYQTHTDGNGYQLILVQDLTDNYNRQRESQLAFEISAILMQSTSISQSLEKALQKIRKFTGWDLIELWSPSYDQSFIKNDISAFYPKNPCASKIKKFVFETRLNQYNKEQYAQVPVYANQQPYWIENLEKDQALVRRAIAVQAGFKSVLAVPILNEGDVVCSVYLFSFLEKKRNEHAEKLIQTLGSLIGTELQKRKRESELDQFFKISPDIMTIAGLDGKFIKVNPAFESFIGYSQEEAKELHPLHYVFEEDRAAVLEKLKDLSKGISVPFYENRVVTKDGQLKWISWTATPIFEEGMIIATHRDITDKKAFEEKIRLINERYEYATKATTNEAIWDLDLKSNEISWSEVFTNMFGYSSLKEDATLGFWESKLHPEDKERVITSFHDFITQSNTANWYCEYRFEKKDGSYAYIVDRGYMIFDDQKQPIRVVGAMEDISDRKKLEEELIQTERMRQMQIAQAAVNAQEKERADVGKELHDNISQMLTSTKLFLDIMRNKTQDELLDRSIRNINTIITEIRNISRSLVPSSIEDLGLIASLNDLLDNIRVTNIIDVEFYPDPEVENLINANYKLTLYRIVQEQINNIVKHANASQVLIELYHEENRIELVITDDGIGFDVNKIKKGHGLKNMRSRAELLNGHLEIITSPQKGCKLKVHIPYQ